MARCHLLRSGPGAAGIDVGDGRENQEHDADDVDFAAGAGLSAELFAGDGVAHFVAGLDHGEGDVKQDEVVGEPGWPLRLAGEFGCASWGYWVIEDAHPDEDDPDDEAGGARKSSPATAASVLRKCVGIDDGHAGEHDVHEIAGDFAVACVFCSGRRGCAYRRGLRPAEDWPCRAGPEVGWLRPGWGHHRRAVH